MDLFAIILGIFALAHGIFWAVMRATQAPVFARALTRAARLGITNPTTFAIIYIVVPLIGGVILLAAGWAGVSAALFTS